LIPWGLILISSDSEGNNDRVSGGELDVPGEEQRESVPEDGQVSGDELDEPGEEERESVPEDEGPKGIWERYRGKTRLSLFIAIGLCLLTGIGYLYLKGRVSNITVDKGGKIPQFDRLGIPKDQLLIFPSFVIPLIKENRKFTYISLSIYFNLPNKEIMGEMIEKKGELRGIIYDILREEINKTEKVPSMPELKGFIVRGVNAALSAGKVNEIYITKYLAV
jgi:flagellar basal body-associated protein FliL